jgi:hypothetical protein
MTDRPLSHMRVLDFGHYLAGPMVGMMLADHGGRGDPHRPAGRAALARPGFDMLSRASGRWCWT